MEILSCNFTQPQVVEDTQNVSSNQTVEPHWLP